ncbi:hypothetical protein CGJ19_22575, partial [Vibrio parahaemolyticus]
TLVFTAQWFSLGGMRCSPLNAALVARKVSNQNHVSKLKIWLMIVFNTGSSLMVKTQFQLFQV